MTYKELFKKIKNLEVDNFGFTKEVLGYKLHIYSHKKQFNIISDDIPRIVVTNYNEEEVKIYIARNGYVDYDHPSQISSTSDEIKNSIAFAIDLLG